LGELQREISLTSIKLFCTWACSLRKRVIKIRHLNFNVPYFPVGVNFLPVFAPANCLSDLQYWLQWTACNPFARTWSRPDWWIGHGHRGGGLVDGHGGEEWHY